MTYEEVKEILLNPTSDNILKAKEIEQSIPSKFATSGLKRVCYFYNAHVLEEQIINNIVGKEILAEYFLDTIKHKYSDYYYKKLPAEESLEENISIRYYDNTHNDFHGGQGTNEPDLGIHCGVSGQYGIDQMNQEWDMEVEWNFMEDELATGEVKIIYNKEKKISDTNLHQADIIYELRFGTNMINIYKRTGTYFNDLDYLGEVEIDTTELLNPDNYNDIW